MSNLKELIFNYYKKIRNSPFSVNILTMFTGTAIAQIVPYFAYILLARLFSPSEFGDFELFLNTAAALSVLATGNYEFSIMLPESDKSALKSVWLSTAISLIFSAFLFVILLIVGNSILITFENQIPSYIIYLLPVSVFFLAFYRIQNYWFNRLRKYGRIATANASRTTSMSLWQLLWGFLSKGVEGLITGAIFGQLVHNIILIVKSGKHFIKYRFTIKELQRSAVRFKKFPIYNLPSEFFNFISARLPIFQNS